MFLMKKSEQCFITMIFDIYIDFAKKINNKNKNKQQKNKQQKTNNKKNKQTNINKQDTSRHMHP